MRAYIIFYKQVYAYKYNINQFIQKDSLLIKRNAGFSLVEIGNLER